MIFIVSCETESKKTSFEVNATLNEFPEGTLVMLRVDGKIDSTYITNGKVNFKGSVKEPRRAALFVEYSNDWLYFWLENEKIDIIAEKWKFKEVGTVLGSSNQKLEDVLLGRISPKWKEKDSIDQLSFDETLSRSEMDAVLFARKNAYADITEITKSFIEEFPNSLAALSALEKGGMYFGKSESARLYALLSEESKKSEYGKSIKKFIGDRPVLIIGDKYVDFEQKDTTGKSVKISEKLGKYTLIEFWASWCGPCRKMTPELQREYKKHKNKGFTIVGVSLDSKKEDWLKAIDKDKIVWDNMSALNGRDNFVTKAYHITSIPDNILLDENGIIIGRKLSGAKLANTLKAFFE